MAVDKLVDSAQLDADLTSVANAIRTKGGTSSDLAFPAGFVSAVEAIPTGGGGITLDDVNKRTTLSGAAVLTGTSLAPYAFVGTSITSVSSETITSGGSISWGGTNRTGNTFAACTSLASVSLPNLTSVSESMFVKCTSLKTLNLPSVTQIWANIIQDSGVEVIVLPELDSLGTTNTLRYDTKLKTADLGSPASLLATTFNGDTVFNKLIIRGSSVCSLANINAFQNTPFASGKAGGTLYVTSALVASYQSASNWSTILGYANNQIKSIESTHTDPNAPIDLTLYYADGTSIT